MKVVFINRYFYPDHSATSQILSGLVEVLGRTDLLIQVIASRQQYDDPAILLSPADHYCGVEVIRVGGRAFGRHSLVGRSLDYLSFYIGVWRFLLQSLVTGDIVVAKTDPPLLGLFISPVLRLRKARLVNWYQDLFPEVAEGLGIRLPKSVFRLLAAMRDRSAQGAVANVVVSERMGQYLSRRGVDDQCLHVIHNWFPMAPEDSGLVTGDRLRGIWGLEGKFIVAYSGNLGRAHDWQTILASAIGLRDQPDIVFLMVGGGAGMQLLREGVSANALDNVIFQPYQPLNNLPESLLVADVHLASLLPGMADYLVPSKVYGVMAVGRPLIFIGEDDSEIGDMLRRDNFGCVVAPGDVNGLISTLWSVRDEPDSWLEKGRTGKQLYQAEYSSSMAYGRWKQLLERYNLEI